jgi:uncharacterized protein (DUF1501 family)
MRRRDFLRSTGLISTSLLLPRFIKASGTLAAGQGRRLVVVQLSGGNDGLNTIVPYADDLYHIARGGLAVEKVIALNDRLGLNAALAPLRSVVEKGHFLVINGVGYPNPDRSHFRSMDIWHTASASDQYLPSGWLGRYLDHECSHPHGVIEFGARLSLANKGEHGNAIALSDPRRFHAATREPLFAHLAAAASVNDPSPAGYLYRTMADTYQSAAYINEHLKARENGPGYPKGEFAEALRNIATFIGNNMETRVYYASISGFDTHVNQLGRQERVLGEVAAGLSAFITDLQEQGTWKDTLVMVFSEFGRRVKRNASKGTDHGTAGNVWLLSGGLKTLGVYNELPSLADLDANGDLKYTVDFRSIYAAVLGDWLGVSLAPIMPSPIDPIKGLFV